MDGKKLAIIESTTPYVVDAVTAAIRRTAHQIVFTSVGSGPLALVNYVAAHEHDDAIDAIVVPFGYEQARLGLQALRVGAATVAIHQKHYRVDQADVDNGPPIDYLLTVNGKKPLKAAHFRRFLDRLYDITS